MQPTDLGSGQGAWAIRKILVADDEEDILVLLQATLEGNTSYQILLATDGHKALDTARRELPDLVLLDVLTPGKDGFQVCQDLKGDPATAQAKVVLVTSLTGECDRARAFQCGADGYVTKPFSPTALLERIEGLLA